MERTISGMVGKGSVNHNTRAFTAKNVDSDRSGANVRFCNEDIKQVYISIRIKIHSLSIGGRFYNIGGC